MISTQQKDGDDDQLCDSLEAIDVTRNSPTLAADIVTPYEVRAADQSGLNYEKIINEFGCEKITDNQLERLEKLTGKKPHRFLRRKLFFAHRDFDAILDSYQKSKTDKSVRSPGFYLYTGRGPSASSIHIGHLIPLLFTKHLSDLFGAPLVLMMSDDEKFFTKDLSFEEIKQMMYSNVKDLIALGFCKEKTYIFSNIESMSHNSNFYPLVCKIQKNVSVHKTKKVFGFEDSMNVGAFSYTCIECAPSFAQFMSNSLDKSMPCLIPCAIDQDPFFRTSRDIASKLNSPKPSLLHSKFIPGLGGYNSKMSSSSKNETILLTDTPEEIKHKISNFAFSGGQSTAADHREKGGNCDIDVSFAYIQYFLEDDDRLEEIRRDYTSGKLLTSHLKQICIDLLVNFVTDFQEKRSKITDDDVAQIMQYRELKY